MVVRSLWFIYTQGSRHPLNIRHYYSFFFVGHIIGDMNEEETKENRHVYYWLNTRSTYYGMCHANLDGYTRFMYIYQTCKWMSMGEFPWPWVAQSRTNGSSRTIPSHPNDPRCCFGMQPGGTSQGKWCWDHKHSLVRGFYLPLWTIWVRQLEWSHSQDMGK